MPYTDRMVIETTAGRTDSHESITGHARTPSLEDVAHALRTNGKMGATMATELTHAELQISGGLRGSDGGTWPRPCPCGKADCWIYGPPQQCDGCGRHSFRVSLVGTTLAGNVFVCSRACIQAAVRNAQAGQS